MYKFPYFTENDTNTVVTFMKENSFAIITAIGETHPHHQDGGVDEHERIDQYERCHEGQSRQSLTRSCMAGHRETFPLFPRSHICDGAGSRRGYPPVD